MKRYFYIAFTFIYLTLCIGVNTYAHFCGNQLTSISAFIDHASCCCDDKPTKTSNCCKESFRSLKITQDHHGTTASRISQPIIIIATSPIVIHNPIIKTYTHSPTFYTSHSPPDLGTPIYIRNCVFTI